MLLFVGCGGGDEEALGSNENQTRSEEDGYRIRIGLYRESDGVATSSISAAEPGQLVVSFTHYATPLVSEVVSFSTTIGELSPGLGTALTDENGEARLRLLPGLFEGAGTVTATVLVPGLNTTLSVDLNFSVTGADTTPQQDVDINLAISSAASSPNTIRVDAPGTLTATVLNQSGSPLANSIVTFTSTLVSFDPVSGAALTDSNGAASILVNAGNTTGVATITAAVTIGSVTYTEILNVTVSPPSVKLGNGSGASFDLGVLQLSVNPLSAGGTAGITVSVVDQNNALFTEPLSIGFSSPCVTQQTASIDAQVTTVNGQATATYRASGCVGSDRITATLGFGGVQFTAIADITIADDSVSSIAFVDAVPNTMVLRGGAGGPGLVETSNVSFQVLGSQGLPVANQSVDFSLTTSVGGITFNPASATTDANGMVSTQVQSGSIPTSVVVIATLTSQNISTQSGLLVISTGVPDQDSMTISFSSRNPEAWQYNGETITVTAFAADGFNNPVPDGVGLSFVTEGGTIEPECFTSNGQCSVIWTSQNPRPGDGVVTIMVSAQGGESFQDENGNGVFDDGDLFTDLTEAYLDVNWNQARDVGERYIDFNLNGAFDLADGLYGGPSCNHSTLCAAETAVTVSDQNQIVMSVSDNAIFNYNPASGTNFTGIVQTQITVSDAKNNSLPGGTTVSLTTDNGTLSISEVVIPDTIYPYTFSVAITELDDTVNGSIFFVEVTTPKGHVSTSSFSFTY